MKFTKDVANVVVRFSGDSGDGMQLTGGQFADTSAVMGNCLSTFPDYPAEIRAPHGTVAGVSGFQVNFGSTEVSTPGDAPDVLVAMNPAALKANLSALRPGGLIIVNTDAFDATGLERAGYQENPLGSQELSGHQVIEAHITSQTLEALKELSLDNRSKLRCRNFYALGMTYFMFNRSMATSEKWIEQKFTHEPTLSQANKIALKAGYFYAETIEAIASVSYRVAPAKIRPGKYRQLNGNQATAWGLLIAAEKASLELFLGSYPITPASEILHELAKFKSHGVRSFQAEDEIAGICTAIGAAFGGALAVTTTSGPGLALKGEGLGLAVMLEVPLVVVNVQRGGPSTGLPTKTEQSDLLQVLYGRNGECPLCVIAASRPSDCLTMAFIAAKIALEHMLPVVLLTDGYIANGAEPWRIPDSYDEEFPVIKTKLVRPEEDLAAYLANGKFLPYVRDEKLARPWAIPGMAGLEHRIGGLEKAENTGNVSYSPENHERMVKIRQQKVDLIAQYLPRQELEGPRTGDLLVVSWGGTYGACSSAVRELQRQGEKVSLMHLKYLNPLPVNVAELLAGFAKIFIPELNYGQLKLLIDGKFQRPTIGYHKIQGVPFKISELVAAIKVHLPDYRAEVPVDSTSTGARS